MNRVIYFKGENCSVCKALYPKMVAHFKANYPKLDFELVEVEKNPSIAAEFSVFTIPVLIIQFEGKEHFRFVRNFSAGEIDHKLKRSYHLMFE